MPHLTPGEKAAPAPLDAIPRKPKNTILQVVIQPEHMAASSMIRCRFGVVWLHRLAVTILATLIAVAVCGGINMRYADTSGFPELF